jgi:hypothetical protein
VAQAARFALYRLAMPRALVEFRSRALLLGALLLMAADARAQAPPPPTVVFFAPLALDAELRAALEDAIDAQLMQLPARLQIELRADPVLAIEKRMEALKHTARGHEAVALFWLEVRSSERWFLYVIDPRAERVVLRQLSAKLESPEAAIEAVALIVRASSESLLHGQPLTAAEPEAPAKEDAPRAPWPTVLAEEPRSRLRVAASYVGTTFARRLNWQHGLALRAAWLWPSGPYVGVGYTFFEPADFDHPDVHFTIDRYPVSAHAGLRFAVGDFTFTGELGLEVELRSRQTVSARVLDPEKPERKVLYSICPKLEAEYALTSWLRVFTSVGPDFVLGNFPYLLDLSPPGGPEVPKQTIVEPHWMRLTAMLGVGIIR